MKMIRFENSREISSQLALVFLLIISALVAWFTVSAGEEIVQNAEKSSVFVRSDLKNTKN
jgi:hypothetical protein